MALTATSFMNENGQIQPKKTGLNYLPSGAIPRLNAQFQQDAVNAYESQSYNNGGFLGGLGYLGEKVAVGFMSSIEGIWDYAAGGLAKLFGADDWAEQQFANDWFGDWYSHPEEWFNPSGGWQTAGDIAGGIGTSLPAIASVVAAAAIAYFSGGTLSPVAAGLIGAGVAGFGAAGTSTKQAYKESGQLTGKEFGYGALTGFTEGALEGVTTALSMGTGQVINSVAKSFAKETTKTVAKQTVIKTLAKGFIGEAFEEGMAEILDPVWQRLTYNPEAQNATPQEVAYAAFVGGMSGMLMSGGNAAIDSGNSFLKGNSLVGKGLDAEVIGLSQQLSEFEGMNQTGDETFQTIAQTYADLAQSLATTDGRVTTVTQKKLLGDLHRANTVAVFKPMIARSAANIVNNAEVIAQRLNEYGYKTTDGKPITFTAEQIREGVDTSNPTSFSDALKNNGVLRTLAIADTTGHLVMDTARFEQATLMGKRLASQVDLNRFIETATPSEISAVSQALGIENWATLDVDIFNQKITSFVENGGVQQYADRRATVQSIQAIPAETARPMPKMVNLRQDGSVRYSDGSTQIAITRQGEAYTVYDYASGHLSKNMTRSEVNKLLRDYNTQQADITAGVRAQMEAESELRRQAEELDTYARENITDYSKLSAPNQSMIRKVIREGRAKGMSDEDVLAYAKISAHAGIDISFDKQATFRGHDEEGNEKYADGFYDPKTNRIVVNPDSKRTHERLLLHELDHAIRQFLGADGVRHSKVFRQALKGVSPEVAQRIAQAYSGVDSSVSKLELAMDETNAYFAEEVLSNRHTLEKLIEAEPTLKEKILSFFKGASEDYKSVPKLSRAARSYYKTYKKLFDEFAERNFQNNATEAQTARLSGEVCDARFSLQFADHIADNQRRFVLGNNVALTQDELERAIDQTAHMVELMSRYKDILPADTVPKKTKATLVKNGSYDISVENTTICVRTLAYNSFVEMVSEKIGRPLTQMESFLVSQKLYDIAKEPQCLYCYVSLDRKAYNDMVLKYIDQRERAIEAYERAGRPDITSESHPLYQEYLAGRKATKPQWKRYTSWIEAYKSGEGFLATQDVATESRRAELARTGTPSQKTQLKDMTDYAQSASQAKKQSDYVAYYDDILRLSAPVVRNLNKHYGLRWYSFSDYSGAFIVENMQQITDASIRGLKGLAYTKDADFVRIFAPTGMNINVSVFVKENADGTFSIDPKQSANATVEELISLREAYPNVGVVATATSDAGVEWALAQGWTDVVIPFHIVRTGSNVADFYKWKNFTFEQSDTVADQSLWDAYVSSVAGENASARKKVSKMIYPSEHQNNRETYLRLIEERGLKPRFASFLDNPNYMKLVNETRQSEAETVALKPVFDVDAAEAAFQKFVDKGGYYEGWYNDGIDVESEAETVAQDVLAGKKANEVSYGRQDIDAEGVQKGRKSNREHGRRFALPLGDETVDARSVTEQDVRTLLDNAFNKQYRDGSYIPVRVNTPSILIEAAQSLGKTIDDLPIILNVGKARQMMSSQREWVLEQKRGTAHDFTVDDVIALIRAMDKPKQIIYQSADERYVEVVEFETAEKTKAVAVLEIGENKNPEYLNGYNGGFYQVLVTAFEPDTGYVETLLGKDGNIRIYPKKKKGSSQRGSGNKVPSHLNESPFANSIAETEPEVNRFDETSSDDRRFALTLNKASGENYRNLVKEINDENNLGTEERNLSAEDIERLERIFDSDIVTDAEDRKLYARALKLIGGYSEVTLEDGSESLTVKVVDSKYYTKEMLRTERANTHAEYETRFFVDSMTFADGEEYNVMGLADTDERIAYAKITEREAPFRKIMHGFSEEVAHFTEEESSVSAISRHERLHLLLRDWIFTDARAVLDAADDLRQLIDAEDGRYAKTFEKVNYWYQRKLHQNGYSFSDYSQEIACDLYSGALVMNDSKIQELVERHIKEIDAAIEGSKVDGVRYALDVDSEGTQLTEAQQEFFRDSKVRDSKGRLLVMYHGTTANFNTFKKGDVGFHFGTKAAARGRVGYGKNAIMKRVHLNITNPIVFEEDLGSWDADYRLTQELFERDILTRDEVEQVLLSDDRSYRRPTEKANRKLAEILLQKGYDGIAYSNTFETKKPTTSYIAFQSNQAKVVENETPTQNPDIRYALSETRGSIMTEVDPEYKPTVQDKVFSGWTAVQIAFTNAQAGIETVGKKYGVRNIESLVQAARSGRNQAEEMIAGNQYRIGADTKTYQGEGLEQIFRPISRQGEEVKGDFFDYLFNYHNMSRMTLEQRSMAEQQTRLDDLKKKVAALRRLNKRIEKLQEQIKALGRSKKDMETKRGLREELAKAKAEAKTLKKEATELEKAAKAFVPLENKPVLGTTDEHGIETVVTAEQSEAIVKKYEEAHPEFKGVAEKVWAFLQNLNQYRVDTGLISQDTFDYLAKLYPHYVPTYRTGATKGIGAIEGKYNLKVKTTIKTAKGSTKNLLPPDVMIARQVMETVRAGQINRLANALCEGAEKSGDTTYIEIVSKERMTDEAIAELDPTELRPKNNEVVFFRNGERITMRVSKEIFAGFNAFNPEVEIHNPLVNGARAINNGFKRLVTSLNPAFLLRNTIRDVQDAGINTRYGKTFLKNYARASYEISHNGKLWQLYKAMGGFSSSVFDFEKGFSGMQNKWGLTKAEGNLLKQTLQGVENANAFVEQLPRLAEFISSIEAGNSAEQAILDSADVTTNFGRMGNITKVLNRTLIPFLNPSIQGCSKMIRNITSIRSAREFASLAFKAALVGVAPMVLNMLMYEDDEDYKNLRDADKENNFLFKVGDTFVKIPRGRVASVIGGLVNRSKTTIEGEDADWAGYVKNIMQQVTPVDSMSRTIFSPFSDVANNITWYGSAIEGRQFENTAPKDRYDENTSSIAIAIGQLINYSPKKIHYLLDQYSGVIGDFILPATTAKAEKDFLSGNFTLDPATSNKLSTEFYEMYDQAQYAKTAGDDTAAYQVRYLNKVKSAISDMYKQKSEIQNNPDLSNAEKLQQTRVVQLLINEAYKTALQDFELYTKAIEATAGMEDENLRFTEATRLMYGAERALSEYNDDVYAKCQMLNKAGVDYEMLYNYYFTVRGITSDKDAQGNTVSGSKRKKVVASIKSMDISVDHKLLLICASGYALQDNDLPRMTAVNAKKRLLRYILNLKGATQTEKTELAEMCGFEVKNGRVVTKSVFSLG